MRPASSAWRPRGRTRSSWSWPGWKVSWALTSLHSLPECRALLRQLVGFNLVAAALGARLLGLPAFGQRVDHVCALRGFAPLGALGLERDLRARDQLGLLRERFAQPREKNLVVAHGDGIEPGA